MPLLIEGRNPEHAKAVMHGIEGDAPAPDVRAYRKTATVLALQLEGEALIQTPEGEMAAHDGDYLVSDDPPTHLWPVRREVFEATYEEVTDGPPAK